jgi:hypothetical protein
MTDAWDELDVREPFAAAARTFAELVRRIPENRWRGLGYGSGTYVPWSGTPRGH